MWKKPAIASKFIKLLSVDLREKEEQLLGFAYHSVRKRVANALISVAEKVELISMRSMPVQLISPEMELLR
ncbi:hypothetical protein KUH03_06360 [Sphingobacterium sp. E70]|uniref:hypothetical protein n=1 Tax=Sphingobacterium sp. E70 TaxID=2853439 RepID=UPI00211CBD24|nr:hypothetical protein [Sphingobacterium sp. E70]ULT26489.1 hypothetical protein KUH03_06360 [Sphingobacterium sp. E70]